MVVVACRKMKPGYLFLFLVAIASLPTAIHSANGGWNSAPDTQYHIQTDEGPERYFRYQTMSGQYRKERRLEDGTVIGSYGWVDANGFLRMRDYIADNQGYRILKTKNIFVGKDRAIGEAVSAAKNAPAEAGILVAAEKPGEKNSKVTPIFNRRPIAVYSTPSTEAPPTTYYQVTATPTGYSTPKPHVPYVQISHNSLPSSTTNPLHRRYPSSTIDPPIYVVPSSTPNPSTAYAPSSTPSPISAIDSNDLNYHQRPEGNYNTKYSNPYIYQNGPTYPIDRNGNTYNGYNNQIGNGYDNQFPYYDGVAVTNDGFRYYLPKQYHEEQTSAGDERTGSFGYVDPFGIRRVIYYNAAPGTGFQHRKNNRYVGFDATPYDPRPYR